MVNFGCLIDFLFSCCRAVDSRLRGNDGNRDFRRLFTVGRILESDKISSVPFFWFRVSKRRIQESDLVYRNTRIIATNRQAATRIRPRQTTVE
ncbi:hypothetical protein A6J88_14100 [Neisseria mucosa]|uniref:Secreted protein n=1 Tax=Neisseria mucosa TaxID=488 RepID=A0ABN5IFQ4_NEIMU|nr:hypothetical protein A6J88_14100 [Neisseria mucosa]